MDIKPFQKPDINGWTDLGSMWMIVLAVALILMATGIIWAIKREPPVVGVMLFLVGSFGMMFSGVIAIESQMDVISDAHAKHVSDLKESLANEGFKIVYGTPDLHPNTQSSLLLSYEGQNFECTLYSGEDVNTSVVFSCGDAARTLAQIKETK